MGRQVKSSSLLGYECERGPSSSYELGPCFTRRRFSRLLTLWKDAAPDIPILKEAKAEYARLQ
jgi:hypothetical protein